MPPKIGNWDLGDFVDCAEVAEMASRFSATSELNLLVKGIMM
jgi:hypothetical protein